MMPGRHRPSHHLRGVTLAATFLVAAGWCRADDAAPTFERDIRPILRAHCLDCHGGADAFEGNLDLRQVRTMQRGGDSGTALIPGDAGASLVLERIRSGEMPPSTLKVKPEELAILERWVAVGAPTARPEPESIPPGLGITPEEREWWAFRPLARPPLPAVARPDLVAQPIDAYLLARLERDGLSFSPPADRATLIRRAAFDLHGLPPTPEEIEAFVADPDPAAFEKLVDRLLASPRYGERWARHWLDAAGYADSAGATQDDPQRPYAWRYRDWVVRALNADMPFDRFLVEQLAGDELVPPPHAQLPPESIERLTATGFLRMAADGTTGGGDPDSRNRVVTDTLAIVSSSLLGLTVGCAQCHDHRYDPIPQTDYYALRALFEPALDPQAWKAPNERLVSLFTDADRARSAEIEAEAVAASKELDEKQAKALAAALEKELLKHPEELREKLGTTYSPGVAVDGSDLYRGYGSIYTSLDVKPAEMDAALAAVQAVAADVRAGRITADEFERARKPIIEGLNQRFENNGFWLGAVSQAQSRTDWLDRTRTLRSDYGSITLAELKTLAAELFDPARAVTVKVVAR